jgi:lactoylglutathione lyase
MLNIEAVNHVGIRIGDKTRSIVFYEGLGFKLIQDVGFDQGRPVVLIHPGGVTLNLLGPSDSLDSGNVLMDVPEKHSGITHVALTVASLVETKAFLDSAGIEITGSFSFKGMSAVFIRDPDRNVIELDAYDGAEVNDLDGYVNHPA